ncbi:MAG TPA: hypothetical protein VH228_18060 [Nocardioides sp.]|jgi:hypothetical protein|nr:hypothetical protein [Nocardioides sp.]
MYGDTAIIRAHARRMRERAHEIRDESAALAGAAEAVPWAGIAADAMRRLAREHAGCLRSCATAHEDAAEALDHHAREVDRLEELIASIEKRVRGLVESATSGLGGLIGHVLPDGIDRWVHDFDPPPPGSREWLDVRVPRSA